VLSCPLSSHYVVVHHYSHYDSHYKHYRCKSHIKIAKTCEATEADCTCSGCIGGRSIASTKDEGAVVRSDRIAAKNKPAKPREKREYKSSDSHGSYDITLSTRPLHCKEGRRSVCEEWGEEEDGEVNQTVCE